MNASILRVRLASFSNNLAVWGSHLGLAVLVLAATPAAAQSVSIADATLLEGDSGTTNMVFNVTLAPAAASTCTVNFATANYTAVQPADYTQTTGTLTFLAGQTAKTVSVPIVGETVSEGTEQFYVNLTAPVNCSLGDAEGVGTITNNDVAVSIADATLLEGDSGSANMAFSVTLSAPKNNLTLSVTYTAATYTAVSPADFPPTTGTVTFLPGEIAKTVNIPIVGDTVSEGTEQFYVNLTAPVNCSLGDAEGVGTITDNDVAVSIADAALLEGDSGSANMAFSVTLSAPKNNLTLSVTYTTATYTAVSPADFPPTTGTVTFLPGEIAKTVNIPVVGDTVSEGTEQFYVNLTAPVNCSLGDAEGVGTITDNDVTVSIADLTATEGSTGGTKAFNFAVTLSAPKNNLTLSVTFTAADYTAVASGDYAPTTGTVTFNPGQTARTATVQVVADLALEGTEYFYVNLSSPVNCSLGDAQGVGTITNDDVQAVITIDDLSLPEGNSGTSPFGFIARLSVPSVSAVSVQFATANGTAIAGSDYTAGSGTVTFAAGETQKTVNVTVTRDINEECDENFFVNLSNPSGAPLSDNQAEGIIENDEFLTCPDLDGDCQQDSSCGGSDCDDLNPEILTGGIEINDGADNNCPGDAGYGIADEVLPPFGFFDEASPTKLTWPAQTDALDYDLLRASSRDLVTGCTLLGSTVDTFFFSAPVPPSRGVFYYVVRAGSPNVGSWGQSTAGVERIPPCAP